MILGIGEQGLRIITESLKLPSLRMFIIIAFIVLALLIIKMLLDFIDEKETEKLLYSGHCTIDYNCSDFPFRCNKCYLFKFYNSETNKNKINYYKKDLKEEKEEITILDEVIEVQEDWEYKDEI